MLVGIVGEMRTGKTLFMTLKLFQDYRSGKKIMSNYNLNFPSVLIEPNDLDNAIREGDTSMYENVNIGLDEIHTMLDSRTSGQKRNRMLGYFATQSGKLDSTIYWTSQFLGQVDKRIRLNTQELYFVKRYKIVAGHKTYLKQNYKGADFHIEIKYYVLGETFNGLSYIYQNTLTIMEPFRLFKLYDTKQRIYYSEQIVEDTRKPKGSGITKIKNFLDKDKKKGKK